MDKKLKISFDFDKTLSTSNVQALAKLLIAAGADVWVLTARHDDFIRFNGKIIGHSNWNDDVRNVMKAVGIPEDKVIYTSGAFKAKTYQENEFDMHFDDDWNEVDEINKIGGNAFLVDMKISDVKHILALQFNGHKHECNAKRR